MINALNDLQRQWRDRQQALTEKIRQPAPTPQWAGWVGEEAAIGRCIQELHDTINSIKPRPLNEASTAKLYRWSDRMVRIMDLMIEIQRSVDRGNADDVVHLGEQLGGLVSRDFLNDIYDLMKQLSNRQAGP